MFRRPPKNEEKTHHIDNVLDALRIDEFAGAVLACFRLVAAVPYERKTQLVRNSYKLPRKPESCPFSCKVILYNCFVLGLSRSRARAGQGCSGSFWGASPGVSDGSPARVIFCIEKGRIVLLHDFVKKSVKIPKKDIDLAVRRRKGAI